MSITLPNQPTANAESIAATAAETAIAQAAFIANATVLINEAISIGFFQIQPYMVPLVTSAYITTYFTALGYTVLFPIIPPSPFNPAFVPGFPEVLPPGYTNWGGPHNYTGPPRIQISWGP